MGVTWLILNTSARSSCLIRTGNCAPHIFIFLCWLELCHLIVFLILLFGWRFRDKWTLGVSHEVPHKSRRWQQSLHICTNCTCAFFFQGFGRSLSLSLPQQQNAIPFGTPEGRPGIHSSKISRQRSLQEKVYKPLTPWEAASRSALGSVDEAFELQGQPSSVACSVVLAGQHKSLPEPPDEWKRRVSLEPAAMGVGRYPPAPPFQAPSLTFSPEKPSFYGPPLGPAQPLNLKGKPSVAYVRQSSSTSKYSPLYGAIH